MDGDGKGASELPAIVRLWKDFPTTLMYQMLFPHAELVLEYRPINEGFSRQWAAVLSNVARSAQDQGKYEEAE